MSKIESEKTLERALRNFVEKEKKGWCLKFLSTFISGLPDRICLIPIGIIFFVEVKTTKQKPEPLQLWIHSKLRKIGFKVYILESTEDLQKIKNDYASI